MPRINVLPQSLINKIAAGEVVERPASVVKELMENSVDAGATRIDVAVQQGGLELVRIVDNGSGIPADELPLALASHATSKLTEADDLFRVTSLGFRGEALASIAEVSRTVLRSRPANSNSGAELEVVGGRHGEIVPCGCPTGTQIEVHNLFFNTPVRRKFLRATQTEFGHISEAFTRIALAAPHIHCTLRHNERSVFDLAAAESPLERIARFFGRELGDNLIWVDSEHEGIRISGYVAHPSQNRSHNRMQYFFLNGRCIRDRALQHALGEAYRGMMMVGRYPIAFLTFVMPPDLVDVNVHPTKMEVRFQDSGRLYSQLLATLRTRFLTTDLTTHVQSADPAAAQAADDNVQLRQQLVDWAKGRLSELDVPAGDASAAAPSMPDAPLSLIRLDRPQTAAPAFAPGVPPAAGSPVDAPAAGFAARSFALQVHNRYLVTESDAGVTIIDQHALHERILYEQLRRRVLAGPVETQALLVPEAIDLSPAEAAAALENRDLLRQLGLRIEPFGGDTVLIAGFPAMLANMNPTEMLRDLVGQMVGGKRLERRDLLDELLHTIACKAAIKAGDRLTPAEIDELLAQRHLVDDAHHCPHGRPTELVFTREELDRQFKRV
jgi:DNA mismatch repair protein MutL